MVACLASALAVSEQSFAQSSSASEPDLATRRVLIEQARQARAESNHGLALARAEQAQRIQSTPSLRLFVAQELIALDRPADAMVQGESCMREAERDATVPNRDALIAACRQLVLDTRSALGMVTVTVRGTRPNGLTIVVASRSVDESLIGVPVAVNPGNIDVEVRAAGFRVARRTVDVRRGGSEEVTVELEREPASTATAITPGDGAVRAEPPRDARRARRRARVGVAPAPIVLVSVGGASLVASVVTFSARQQAIASCAIENERFVCADSASAVALVSRADEAESLTLATQSLLVGGAVVALAGAVWLAVDRATAPSRERASIALLPSVGAVNGLALGGSF